MEAVLMNKKFERVKIIDSFKSFIWTDRFDECGDFELYMRADPTLIGLFRENPFVFFIESEHLMIIEKLKIESTVEDGDWLVVSGRSLESILDRRIVWATEAVYDNSLQNFIHKILTNNIMFDTTTAANPRRVPNMEFVNSEDKKIVDLKVTKETDKEDLLTIITDMCQEAKIGFKMTLTRNKKFRFELYNGEDRSYGQTKNPYVLFSKNMDNLISSDFTKDTTGLKNFAYILGCEYPEKDEETPTYVMDEYEEKQYGWAVVQRQQPGNYSTTYGDNTLSGLDRRELFVDASSLNVEDIGEGPAYTAAMQQEAKEQMKETVITMEFDGEMDYFNNYKYGVDYKVGDIVQVIDEYGNSAKCRITEVIWSEDESGIKNYPKFESIEDQVAMV